MNDVTVRSRKSSLIIGSIAILVAFLLLWLVGYGIYTHWFRPSPTSIALSAYFVNPAGAVVSESDTTDTQSQIRISGVISRDGKAVPSGMVRVAVVSADQRFSESTAVPLKDGHFAVDEPALHTLHPGAALTITADVSMPDLTESATIHLNSQPSSARFVVIGFLVTVFVIAAFFLYAFTGRKTASKNQNAIRFSYLIIVLFLATPILAPVFLLTLFPAAVNGMIGVPAGLLVAHTNPTDKESQWVINIGGYSHIQAPPAASPAASAAAPAAQRAAAASSVRKPLTPAALPTSAVDLPKIDATSPSAASLPQDPAAAAAADVESKAVAPAVPVTAAALAPMVQDSSGSLIPPVVIVEGGIVVPLYVIILSTLGGAINMTRKVPGLQREGEESDSSLPGYVEQLGRRVQRSVQGKPQVNEPDPRDQPPEEPMQEWVRDLDSLLDVLPRLSYEDPPQPMPRTSYSAPRPAQAPATAPAPSVEEMARNLDTELNQLVAEEVRRDCESDAAVSHIQAILVKIQDLFSKNQDAPLMGHKSYDEWFSTHPRLREVLRGGWRVELLNQYMYLISAPFLAVVTYYLLDLLGLSKPGVVVVLSFSVGLISEKIVSWILGVATGYLQTPKKA